MTWSKALEGFLREHGRKLSWRESMVMTSYPWEQMSIPGLWSYRGAIWKKYAGSMPTPEEVGLPSGHSFFDPDVVCTTTVHYSNGRKGATEHYHRGRKLKPSHRLFPRTPT